MASLLGEIASMAAFLFTRAQENERKKKKLYTDFLSNRPGEGSIFVDGHCNKKTI